MCGIVGYIGPQSVVPVIIEGLRRLEYRGYDSAGIAVAGGPEGLAPRRAPGKLRNLETVIANSPIDGSFGIGHTRWATHGRPTEENAHPHRDGSGTLVVVHHLIEDELNLAAGKLPNPARAATEANPAEAVLTLATNGNKPDIPLEEA